MKKLALSLAVLFSVAMVSCGNAEKAADSCCDTTVVEETVEVLKDEGTMLDYAVIPSPSKEFVKTLM